jgi:hypothetical protein
MGRQGGIARFTGSVLDINCYFDTGIEVVRRKPAISKKRWKKSPSYHKSRESAKVFGASSVIAAARWRGLPAPMKRLADGSAYGRLVGAVRELTERDGQIWDAGMLQGMDLSLDSVGPHFVAPAAQRGQGLGTRGERSLSQSLGSSPELVFDGKLNPECEAAYRLVGIDQLMAELDEALGDSAGKMPLKCQIAHPFWTDGLVHTEAKGEAESKRFFEKIKGPGARGQGPEDRVSVRPERTSVVNQAPVRRVRVWVHATEVVETKWNPWQMRYMLADGERRFSNGFVTSWEQNLPNAQNSQNWKSEYLLAGRDWRTEWMGDGIYVVYTAIEVQEKRGRHWVRLPWCCKFGIQDVVVVAGGVELRGQGSEMEFERLGARDRGLGARDQGLGASLIAGDRPWFGKVGYLDENGEIVIVEGWPEVGREIKVWNLERLLPPGKLLGVSEYGHQGFGLSETEKRDGYVAFATDHDTFSVDLVGENGVLVESKGQFVPVLYRERSRFHHCGSLQGFVSAGDYLDFGIARILFSKAFAMAEAIACANSGQWPPFRAGP